ncbi:MAG: tetratricopeptide repeat protein [Verrucomicrobiae bacterium]|nr:tetratricopeptide repeat protein [Verrucomicrobiae bacterium]
MDSPSVQDLVDEGTLDFTLGENSAAVEKLEKALEIDPDCFEACLALAEVYLSERKLDEALAAAEKGHALNPEALHINTTLSRIWVEKGDKEKAEHFAAQVRMISWKEELKENPQNEPSA